MPPAPISTSPNLVELNEDELCASLRATKINAPTREVVPLAGQAKPVLVQKPVTVPGPTPTKASGLDAQGVTDERQHREQQVRQLQQQQQQQMLTDLPCVEVVCPNCHAVGLAPVDFVCLCVVCGQQLCPTFHHHQFLMGNFSHRQQQRQTSGGRKKGGWRQDRAHRSSPDRLWKTKLCIAGTACKFGDRCWFAHSEEELRGDGGVLPKNWKTAMCRSAGTCKFGEHCWFAHTEAELRAPGDPLPLAQCGVITG